MSKPLKGEDCIKAAKKAGLDVEYCNGSHIKIIAPEGRGYEVVYRGEMSTGVSCSVRKWFKMLSILLIFSLIIVYICYLP